MKNKEFRHFECKIHGRAARILGPKLFFVLCVVGNLSARTAPVTSSSSANTSGPRIEFDSKSYDFGQVLAGVPVRHLFAFTNVGASDLTIKEVLPTCGCTKAGEWTRRVRPGDSGVIPLQLNTGGFNGKVDRDVKIVSDDPSQPVLTVKLHGSVRKVLDMVPSVAVLNLLPDCPFGVATIHITNCLEQPLALYSAQSTNAVLSATLKTNVPGQDYLLMISNNTALPPGPLLANIMIGTSLTNMSVLRVLTMAIASPTFTVEPAQIALYSTPSSSNRITSISIINNSTNPVSLSDPELAVDDIQVSLEEIKPGYSFATTLIYPAGFSLPLSRTSFLSIRTTNPRVPRIEVPIVQASSLIPAAPVLDKGSAGLMHAPLPLVFQTEAVDSLKLGEEQLQEISELRTQFIEAVGGLGQDPRDPSYLARWQQTRPKIDALLPTVVGERALMQFDRTPTEN